MEKALIKELYPDYRLRTAFGHLVTKVITSSIAQDIITIKQAEIKKSLAGRSAQEFNQIAPFLPEDHDVVILDYGCGDMGVSHECVKHGYNNILGMDVADYRKPETQHLKFQKINTDADLTEYQNQFDVVLLLTVMHHAQDPLEVLKNAISALKPGGRLIVIESVLRGEGIAKWIAAYRSFFWDILYNKGFNHADIPCPLKHLGTREWEFIFSYIAQQTGRKIVINEEKDLGYDLEIVKEPHYLYSLTVL